MATEKRLSAAERKDERVAHRKARKMLGLSQSRLAANAKVDRSMLSQWENGKLELSREQVLSIGRAIGEVMKERAEAKSLPWPQVPHPSLGRIVADQRRKWGITQRELADKADMAEDSVSVFENGYVELEHEDEESLFSALDSLIAKKRIALGLPPEQPTVPQPTVPLSEIGRNLETAPAPATAVKSLTDALASHKRINANLEELVANQREIIEEYKAEIARLELLAREIGESKDREIQTLREQLEAKNKGVTVPAREGSQ